MVILGVSDGLDTGAALVVDDRLVSVSHQSHVERRALPRTFPWDAIEQVLSQNGLAPDDVDLVAVAGRITPPFFARRHPTLRRTVRNPFSPAVDAGVFYQAMLRGTGFGAMEADRAAEWLDKRFRERGFTPARLVTVDVHRCLAAAAYRGQDQDHCLILSMHPLGDGAAVAVHRARAGQVDRIWDQKGFAALHTHLQRCAGALGLDLEDLRLMWGAAGRAEPDEALRTHLASVLYADGHRLSRRVYPVPASRTGETYALLGKVSREVAAASILENLADTVCDLVRYHLRRVDTDGLVLAGAIFDNPRLCARVAALDEVEWTSIYPEPGWASLAAGAALTHGGLHPRRMPVPGLGKRSTEPAEQAAIDAAGLDTSTDLDPVEVLGEGGSLGCFVGRTGWGPVGCGSRAVLVRADDAAAVERARRALGRDPLEEPALAVLEDEAVAAFPLLPELRSGTRCGGFAPPASAAFAARYPGGVLPDGRALLHVVDASNPALLTLLTALRERTGCGAVAMWPLARGRDPIADGADEALRVFRQSGLGAMMLGGRALPGDAR